MIHAFAFSGGKDSTALLLWAKERGHDFQSAEAIAVFADTGWEHPLTYAYIEEINRLLLGGRLVTLKPIDWPWPTSTIERYSDMRDLVEKKRTIPPARRRFCTQYLKTRPMQAYIASLEDEVTVYQGVRAEESAARAALPERQWSDELDAWIERPLLRWPVEDVFATLKRHGVTENPLYRLGSKRVGCFPCVMTRHQELKRLSLMMPEVWERIEELERLAGSTFFPPDYIPARFCTGRDAKGQVIALSGDVRKYLLGTDDAQLAMYGETPACLSVYNLCE